MTPFWSKIRAMKPWLETGYEEPPETEFVATPEQMEPIHKESLCIMCGCCVSECNSMESDPEFLGPAALAKGFRFVGDPRDRATVERLECVQRRARDLGLHALLLLQRALPEGRRSARCDREARRRVDEHGIDRDMGAKHAKWFVVSAKTTGWLRETELVPKTQGTIVQALKETKFALSLARRGKVPIPFPPHVAKNVKESRALYDLVKAQGVGGAAGIVQGEQALDRVEHHEEAYVEAAERGPYGPGSFPVPYLPELPEAEGGAA